MAFPLDWLDEDLPENTLGDTRLSEEFSVTEPDSGIRDLTLDTIRAPSPWEECVVA